MIRPFNTVLFALLALASAAQEQPAFPVRPAPEPSLSVDQIDEKIADLQRQMEALEQKKVEAERLSELREQLAALHGEGKDRIKDADEQLASMEAEEKPTTPAQHALCEGRRTYLERVKSLSVKMLGIKDPQALEQAQLVREAIDVLESEWRVVDEPKLSAARVLEELAKSLEEDNNQYRRELLERLRQLAAQDAESRSQELAILSARREREKLANKLTQDFYRSP